MARQPTKKQRMFAKAYVEQKSGTQAALKAYDTTSSNTAKAIASENLTKPNVLALIEDYAERATKNVQTLAETAENEAVRLNANKDQLDRAGYKAIEKTQSVVLNINTSDPKALALAKEYEEKLKDGRISP